MLRLSAAETQYFALCSVDLFEPHIDRTKECRFWNSWVKHVEYLKIIVQHEVTATELFRLDVLVMDHQHLFSQARRFVSRLVSCLVTCLVTCLVARLLPP